MGLRPTAPSRAKYLPIGYCLLLMAIQPMDGNDLAPSTYLELRHASTSHPIFVVVPERRFIAIDGIGGPRGEGHRVAAQALRAVHDALLWDLRRRRLPVPHRRTVLECQWQAPSTETPVDPVEWFDDRWTWRWRQLIEIPPAATDNLVRDAIAMARSGRSPHAGTTRPHTFVEGASAQLLHVGGRDGQAETVHRLLAIVEELGHAPAGPLHELILAAADEVPDGRGRTILRQPIA